MDEFFKTLFTWALQGDRLAWLLVFLEGYVIWKLYSQGRSDLISGLKARETMAVKQVEALNKNADALEELRRAVESLQNIVTLALNVRGR